MNASLAKQRCLNHHLREAVARCPECKHFYCRECITEHEDRIICSNCLRRSLPVQKKSWGWVKPIFLNVKAVAGFVAAWFVFMAIGKILLAIPTEFHEGTVWKSFPMP